MEQILILEDEQKIKFKMMDGIKFKRDHDIRLDHIELIKNEIECIRVKQDMLTDNETLRALKLMDNQLKQKEETGVLAGNQFKLGRLEDELKTIKGAV